MPLSVGFPCPHTGTSTPELGSAEARGPVQALGLCRPQWRSKLSALHALCKHLQLCPLAQLQPELQVFFTLHSQSPPPGLHHTPFPCGATPEDRQGPTWTLSMHWVVSWGGRATLRALGCF